jgi:hypothetical protein
LALGIWVFSGPSAMSDDGGSTSAGPLVNTVPAAGTLGWGAPGVYPGFPGFGLSFHLGYGYGGGGLGVGADGGYPFYGGPGYPHPWPPLGRCGPIAPVVYFQDPGSPCSFQLPGELVVTKPVAMQETGTGLEHTDGGALYPYDVGYGPFTGTRPYPESFFAPFTAAAAASGSSAGVPGPPAPASANVYRVAALGIDEQAVVDVDGVRGIKVARVYPGAAAEKAGLKPGDVIRSINGYRTEQPGNLSWIIVNAAPDKVLKINVRAAVDANEQTIAVTVP